MGLNPGGRLVRFSVPDLGDLCAHIGTWLRRDRAGLLNKACDPGVLFVKTVKTMNRDAAYDQPTDQNGTRLTIQCTIKGAISRYTLDF